MTLLPRHTRATPPEPSIDALRRAEATLANAGRIPADYAQQVRWITDVLRQFEIPKIKAEIIARALIEDGITTMGKADA